MELKPLVLGVAVLASGFADAPTFVEEAKLHDPTPPGWDISYFATSVAIGDQFFVVGEPGDDFDGEPAGEVHVFFRGAEPILLPSASFKGNDLGAYVDLGRDVSAYGSRFAVTDGVSTFVFRHDHGQWIEEGVIPYGGFSISLADRELAIGVLSSGLGSVVVFRLDEGLDRDDPSDDTWLEDAWVSSGVSGDGFGREVVLRRSHLFVGAIYGHTQSVKTGLTYVFERERNGGWIESAVLEPIGATASAYFGYRIDAEGDLALVGAPSDHPTSTGSGKGAAFVYRKDPVSGAWTSEGKLTIQGGSNDWLGASVAIAGETLCVGAHFAEAGQKQSAGAIYQFESRRVGDGTATWHATNRIVASDAHQGGMFGYCMADRGDVLLVGCSKTRAYLFAAE